MVNYVNVSQFQQKAYGLAVTPNYYGVI